MEPAAGHPHHSLVRSLARWLAAALLAAACAPPSVTQGGVGVGQPPGTTAPPSVRVDVTTTPSPSPATSAPPDTGLDLVRGQLLFFWSQVREAYPWMPDADVSVRPDLRAAYYGGLAEDGRARIALPPGLNLPLRNIAWHEAGHAALEVASRLTGTKSDRILTAFWPARGLPGTWEDQERKGLAARAAGLDEVLVHDMLPQEVFADTFAAVAIDSYPDSKAFPGIPFHRTKMRAFFESLPTFMPLAVNALPLDAPRGDWAFVLRATAPNATPSGQPRGVAKVIAVPLATDDTAGPAREVLTYLTSFDPRLRDTNVLARQLSPDGKRLVLSVPTATDSGAWRYALVTVVLETAQVRQLTTDPTFHDLSPAWSPDGTRIAFARSRALSLADAGLWTIEANSGEPRRFLDGSTSGSTRVYGWTADATGIAFDASTDARGFAVLDVGSGAVRRVPGVATSVAPASWRRGQPAVVLALASAGDGAQSRVEVRDRIGDAPRVLVQAAVDDAILSDPRWSPSGAEILYARTEGLVTSLYIAPLSGPARRLPTTGAPIRGEWTPGGAVAYLARETGSAFALMATIRADGGQPIEHARIARTPERWLETSLDLATFRYR